MRARFRFLTMLFLIPAAFAWAEVPFPAGPGEDLVSMGRVRDKPESPGKSEAAKDKAPKDKGDDPVVAIASPSDSILDGSAFSDMPAASRAALKRAMDALLYDRVPASVLKAVLGRVSETGPGASGGLERATEALARLELLSRLTHRGAWPAADQRETFFMDAERALSLGVGERAVSSVIAWAVDSGSSPRRAGATLVLAAGLRSILGADDADTAAMARAIAGSSIPDALYPELAGLAFRAAASGMGPDGFVAALRSAASTASPVAELSALLP